MMTFLCLHYGPVVIAEIYVLNSLGFKRAAVLLVNRAVNLTCHILPVWAAGAVEWPCFLAGWHRRLPKLGLTFISFRCVYVNIFQ